MDENPYDPRELARRHYRENLWLRHGWPHFASKTLLRAVVRELTGMRGLSWPRGGTEP
jgi:hypothetical protein